MPRKAGATSKQAKWTSEAEAILIDALKGALLNGTNGDNNFQPQVYNDISARLRAAGFEIDGEQVKNRWTRVCSSSSSCVRSEMLTPFL